MVTENSLVRNAMDRAQLAGGAEIMVGFPFIFSTFYFGAKGAFEQNFLWLGAGAVSVGMAAGLWKLWDNNRKRYYQLALHGESSNMPEIDERSGFMGRRVDRIGLYKSPLHKLLTPSILR